MKPKISVILPVYNTGNILKKTVNSILKQEFSDFELLIIDDGSCEETKKICDAYSLCDPRVKVFHKCNGGICDARNYGLKRAQGEYLTFCDHDDIYDKNILLIEYETIVNEKADMVVVGKRTVSKKKQYVKASSFVYNKKDIKNNICSIISNDLIANVWNILYRREIICDIEFDVQLKKGQEDIIFNLSVIKNCEKVVSVGDILYSHIVRENLSTSAKIHKELVPAMVKTNNYVYDVIGQMCDVDIYRKQYIKAQGDIIKSCLVYSVKAGLTYDEFCEKIKQLQYYKVKTHVIEVGIPIKDSLVFFCVRNRFYRSLFFHLKMYEIVKKISRRDIMRIIYMQ